MAKPNMKAIKMPFKEAKFDKEGNILRDKKTGEIQYEISQRLVRHNAAYFPSCK